MRIRSSIFTRAKPSARSSSSSLPYSPLRPRTTGASTMKRVPSASSITWSMICSADWPDDRAPADRAVRLADARPQQAQVVVDLGHGADRRARVARGRLLVDRDRRREPLDRVHVRLVHLAEELARVGRQRLDVAPLALRVDRVEREARLARSGQPRDHHQRVARQLQRDVLQVVLARPRDDDLVARCHRTGHSMTANRCSGGDRRRPSLRSRRKPRRSASAGPAARSSRPGSARCRCATRR